MKTRNIANLVFLGMLIITVIIDIKRANCVGKVLGQNIGYHFLVIVCGALGIILSLCCNIYEPPHKGLEHYRILAPVIGVLLLLISDVFFRQEHCILFWIVLGTVYLILPTIYIINYHIRRFRSQRQAPQLHIQEFTWEELPNQ